MSEDTTSLLQDLQIDREDKPPRLRPVLWFLLIAVVAGVGFVGYYFVFRDSTPIVESALAVAAYADERQESVLDATGFVVARNRATVSSKVPGKVKEIFVEEGMLVEKDQLVATLDDSILRSQLELAEAQLHSSRTSVQELDVQLAQAQVDLIRTEKLVELQHATAVDLEQARLSVERLLIARNRSSADLIVAEKHLKLQSQYLDDMRITAPFRGIVVAKAAQPGEMIAPVAGGGFTRTGICTIVDMDSLEVEIDVNESYINRVAPGQQVTVQLNAYPDVKMPAAVLAIIPTADRAKATVRVRVKFSERDERVLPDMAVRVAFLEEGQVAKLEEIPQGVLVPDSALDGPTGSPIVWVVKESRVRSREVRVGEAFSNKVRVLDGLRSGERVITAFPDALRAVLEDDLEVRLSST